VLAEPSFVRPRRKALATRLRLAGLVSVVVLASGCGDDSSSAGSTTPADADQPSTTISAADDESCAADDADADGLEPLMLDEVAPAFAVQPDEAFDTGPSDLAKAVADDGQDDAREVLTSRGFRRGYQRIWTDDMENQIIVFVYEFCDSAGANAYADRASELRKSQPGARPVSVPGVEDASGYVFSEGNYLGASVDVAVGPHVVTALANGTTDTSAPTDPQVLAMATAANQASRLPED
jgi:hypothetical protein